MHIPKLPIAWFLVMCVETAALVWLFGFWLPVPVDTEAIRSYYQKIIDVDGVLLGFSGVVFAVSIERWKEKYLEFLVLLVPVVSWYLISIIGALVDMLVMGTVTLLRSLFLLPLLCLVFGATWLFFAMMQMSSS